MVGLKNKRTARSVGSQFTETPRGQDAGDCCFSQERFLNRPLERKQPTLLPRGSALKSRPIRPRILQIGFQLRSFRRCQWSANFLPQGRGSARQPQRPLGMRLSCRSAGETLQQSRDAAFVLQFPGKVFKTFAVERVRRGKSRSSLAMLPRSASVPAIPQLSPKLPKNCQRLAVKLPRRRRVATIVRHVSLRVQRPRHSRPVAQALKDRQTFPIQGFRALMVPLHGGYIRQIAQSARHILRISKLPPYFQAFFE